MVVAAMVAAVAAGCQKEEKAAVDRVVTRQVEYSVDNVKHCVTVEGDAAWRELLDGCMAQVEGGHLVHIGHGGGSYLAKERVTYVTESREAAMAWVGDRFNEGYDVTMWYDEEEGKYVCVASKVSTSAGGAPNGFVYIPLQQYLPGTWTKCMDRKTALAPGAAYVELDPEYGILSMTWEQIYDFYRIEPSVANDATVNTWQFLTGNAMMINGNPYTYKMLSPYRIGLCVDSSTYVTGTIRMYEWSQDTLLAYTNDGFMILPEIYVRVNI